MTREVLRQLMNKHEVKAKSTPLLPFDNRFQRENFSLCQLDICSKMQEGGCDTCPDLEECRKAYDKLC